MIDAMRCSCSEEVKYAEHRVTPDLHQMRRVAMSGRANAVLSLMGQVRLWR